MKERGRKDFMDVVGKTMEKYVRGDTDFFRYFHRYVHRRLSRAQLI